MNDSVRRESTEFLLNIAYFRLKRLVEEYLNNKDRLTTNLQIFVYFCSSGENFLFEELDQFVVSTEI